VCIKSDIIAIVSYILCHAIVHFTSEHASRSQYFALVLLFVFPVDESYAIIMSIHSMFTACSPR